MQTLEMRGYEFINKMMGDLTMLTLATSQNRNYLKCGDRDMLFVSLDISPDESTQIAPKNHHVALVIDSSDTMDGRKMEEAKEAAVNILNNLSPGDLVSVVTFDTKVKVKMSLTPASDHSIEIAIRSINPGGGTAMYGGLEQAMKLMQNVSIPGMIHKLILFSDGEPNEPPTEDEYFNDISTKLRKSGTTLDVIGIGDEYNERLLKMMAEAGGGGWEHVGDNAELTRIVDTQITKMQNTVIVNPQLELELMKGAELVSIEITMPTIQEIGPESRYMEGNTVYIGLKDIIKDESQVVAMKISMPPINGKEVPFLTAAITEGGSELTHQTAVISCSDDPGLYNSESDPSPRAIFESSEATILLGKGLEGDSEATK
ncbi:MAG: VWA domain-containing protein, partial [Nitrosopumilus sp. H13]